jgi:hypothetical protein
MDSDFFLERPIDAYVKKLRDVLDIISLSSKYKIIGSSNIKNILYNSDYDVDGFYNNTKGSVNKIVKYFQYIFRTLDSKRSYSYITDFKCGVDDEGEPLKWTKEEVKANKKRYVNEHLNDVYITLGEAIQQKSLIKLDVVSFINNTFIEISEKYYIKLKGDANVENSNINVNEIINSLKENEAGEIKDDNYNKALKRNFSWRSIKNRNDPKLKKLLEFFNSSVGILNKARSDLDVLILLLEKQKPVLMKHLLTALDNMKFQISYNTIEDLTNDFLKLEKIKTKTMIYKPLLALRKKIYNIVNKYSKAFYKKNKF